ncbi:YbcC family protein [Spirosoma utsteinense]|uniref:YbcC family protein n=1 Tax=Spirosoma utsteinense TaxID=2585773 RepID=UPI0016492E42|nr:DUF2309 domain-containing protein [Spirosoma utsteinense]MBC3784010.1 hypothetical protein [Spirosoma utsteinense]
MNIAKGYFDEHAVLHALEHYLPAQAPLKDFIHHNTLHAFQDLPFYEGLNKAYTLLGYNTSLSLGEYRRLYTSGLISPAVLQKVIIQRQGEKALAEWTEKLLATTYDRTDVPRVGTLRANWKRHYQVDLDSMVHPTLFRILCSYLDQGISIWNFPIRGKQFIDALREMESRSYTSFFRGKRAKQLLVKGSCTLTDLLAILVGDETLYEHYLYDQQFAHQGWSGMVAVIENQPQTLLDPKQIALHDVILFELLLEIDALDFQFGPNWKPLSSRLTTRPVDLSAPIAKTELSDVLSLWQDIYEWNYYDQVLTGVQRLGQTALPQRTTPSFQAFFCIDDRECSFRRHIEHEDPDCETFGTPGFFGVEFFYQPEEGKFYEKACPAPVTPKYLIKEVDARNKRKKDVYFTKHAHSFYSGWLIAQTLGLWSVLRLFLAVFNPSMSAATASSLKHMHKRSRLTIENQNPADTENGLQIGFGIDEMADRVERLLNSIGLVRNFAPVIYVVGHGSSTANNPHYAAYDCGACSGRAGSVNSRVLAYMGNKPAVRAILRTRGISIPDSTQFMGALHDTTRDEIVFFDEETLTPVNLEAHNKRASMFEKALDMNAKERSRRFASVDSTQAPDYIHEQLKKRSVSLFEPRPELNHATNALCLIGRRSLSKGLFLDRRSFLNSYDYQIDPEGIYLSGILNAAAPVCGGINLEYFFSRVDNQKLGAGTKLPHNVMGLIGVSNGIDGDLRSGLPSQMIEVHDPVRLMMLVEHYPDVVIKAIKRSDATYEWFINEWIRLVAVHPETRELFVFRDGNFVPYVPLSLPVETVANALPLIESDAHNLPVHLLA